jgi:hypothetical protein
MWIRIRIRNTDSYLLHLRAVLIVNKCLLDCAEFEMGVSLHFYHFFHGLIGLLYSIIFPYRYMVWNGSMGTKWLFILLRKIKTMNDIKMPITLCLETNNRIVLELRIDIQEFACRRKSPPGFVQIRVKLCTFSRIR